MYKIHRGQGTCVLIGNYMYVQFPSELFIWDGMTSIHPIKNHFFDRW